MAAWVNGAPTDHEAAFAAGADLLARARLPGLAGLVADVDGIRAGLQLAEAIGAVVDPLAAPLLYPDLASFAAAGAFATTPAEAAARADLVVAIGDGAAKSSVLRRLADSSPVTGRTAGAVRRIISLGGSLPGDIEHVAFPAHPAGLSATIGLLRAVAGGRLTAGPELTALVESLRTAQFGVVIYDPGELGELAAQMLIELLQELSETARCFALTLADEWQGRSVVQVAAWTTGLPLRQSFGRGFAEHDPWRFDLERAAAAGEVDAVLWLAPLQAPPHPYGSDLPVVALIGRATGGEARVVIEVAVPGATCGGAMWDDRRGAISYQEAVRPEQVVSPADALGRLEREVVRLRRSSC